MKQLRSTIENTVKQLRSTWKRALSNSGEYQEEFNQTAEKHQRELKINSLEKSWKNQTKQLRDMMEKLNSTAEELMRTKVFSSGRYLFV